MKRIADKALPVNSKLRVQLQEPNTTEPTSRQLPSLSINYVPPGSVASEALGEINLEEFRSLVYKLNKTLGQSTPLLKIYQAVAGRAVKFESKATTEKRENPICALFKPAHSVGIKNATDSDT